MTTDAANQALLAEAHGLCADDRFREIVWRHCSYLKASSSPERLDTSIDGGDQMLWHSLVHHRDANAAFSQYFNVALQQYNAAQQVLRACFPAEAVARIRFLDFACGYGRLLRFLTQSLPVENIYAAEIQAEALEFVRRRFGVRGILSHAAPEAFQPQQRFHMIWVASLFSHLPERLFGAWLNRLVDCLEPDGILCFSVHDACLLPPGLALPAEGILFQPCSENADLDSRIYGTTYVNETYVTGAIAGIPGGSRSCVRIPRGLAHEQDLYVVGARPERDLSALRAFRHGPWGWVDQREVDASGQLHLRGWAASLDDGPLPEVEISVDGEGFVCPTGLRREDVGRVFADARLETSGWDFRCPVRAGAGAQRVVVTARTGRNEMALLYAGLIERPVAQAVDSGRAAGAASSSQGT